MPLALTSSTLNAAKGMILGNWTVGENTHGDEADEDAQFFSNLSLALIDPQET